jgi:hypothetical protein
MDEHGDNVAVVEIHYGDDYDMPWGHERLSEFYIGWCGEVLPIIMYDGYWFWYEARDFPDGLIDRLGEPTDVTIELTAREINEAEWTVMARSARAGRGGKRMRIYAVETLDHFPDDPSYSRNTLRQAALTQDVDLDPGECAVVESTFNFDDTSWSRQEDIRIVVWAQETADTGPANVFQAAQMVWPFPQQAGSAEPEYPRDFDLGLPLYDGEWSAWLEDARPAAVLASSDEQLQATYQVLCGDTSGLYPVDDPPTTDQPIPQVRADDGAIPVFAAGYGTQNVLLCDYHGFGQYPNAKWGVPAEGGPVEVPACSSVVRPSGPTGLDSDGYLVLYKAATATAYDFRQATTVRYGECQSLGAGLSGTHVFEAAQADFGDIHGSGANATGVWGARPAGTAAAGAILPEDVESGDIAHALRWRSGLRNLGLTRQPLASDVVYPASTTDGDRYSINPDALAAGQRLRLKGTLVAANGSTLNEQWRRRSRRCCEALRRSGPMVDSRRLLLLRRGHPHRGAGARRR